MYIYIVNANRFLMHWMVFCTRLSSDPQVFLYMTQPLRCHVRESNHFWFHGALPSLDFGTAAAIARARFANLSAARQGPVCGEDLIERCCLTWSQRTDITEVHCGRYSSWRGILAVFYRCSWTYTFWQDSLTCICSTTTSRAVGRAALCQSSGGTTNPKKCYSTGGTSRQ